MKSLKRNTLFFLLTLAIAPVFAFQDGSADAAYVRQHYTKFEHLIPMRDGVRLFTTVYIPNNTSQSWPIMMTRTPYSAGPYGADSYKTRLGPYSEFDREGFIFVYQDVRGKYMSEGEFDNMRPHKAKKSSKSDIDESTDTYDTIDWLVKNIPNNNGRVGMRGISYPGFYTAAGVIDNHPALKAASPQAPIADWFWDDMHHHGAFAVSLAFNFFSSFGVPRTGPTTERAPRFNHVTKDGYRWFLELGPLKNVNEKYLHGKVPFWNAMTEHPNYDEFWQSRSIIPHLKNINCAVLIVGGLYDAEDLYGPYNIYRSIEENNPNTQNSLVMGPWRHGGWARGNGEFLSDSWFGFPTSEYYRQHVELPFFKHHLKDGPKPNLPEALVFETGANRWRQFDQWPPKATKRKLYLHSGGGLSFDKPTKKDAYDAYISDPAKPVPYTSIITNSWEGRYMAEDQRFVASRPDVLVFETEELTENITLAGPITVNLQVSTSESAADWVVKLIDVQPGDAPNLNFGDKNHVMSHAQLMIRSDIFRGRFRESYEHPKPFKPGEITTVSFPLQDVLHTFKKGHRIMIQIQSSLFPMFDRNPQKYVPNIFEAKESDFIKAEHRVYSSKSHATWLEVGVLQD